MAFIKRSNCDIYDNMVSKYAFSSSHLNICHILGFQSPLLHMLKGEKREKNQNQE